MVKFKNLLERLNLRAVAKKSTIDSRHSSVGRRPTDAWSTLERLIKRGLPEDVVAWRQDPEVQKSILQLPGVDIDRGAGGGGGGGEGGSESEEGENETDGTKEKVDEGKEEIKRLGSDGGFVNLSCNLFQEQMNIPRYLHRSSDFSDMICVTPLQLAVIESKVDVVLALLLGLTEDQLYRAVTTQASIIRKDENSTPAPVGKKSFAETRKFFSVSTISGSRVEMEPRSEQQLDWKDTKEWTTLHLAVMYDIECLKVLLYLLEKEGSPARVEEVLDARNSKGRTVLHLAARSPISSTSTRLLLDLGVQVDCTDEYGLTPLHMAVKFGVLDTVRILLQQGGDKSNGGLDINGRSLLHHSSSVEITRYLLRRGFSPDLSTLKYQTRKGGIDNVRLFLDDTFIRRDNLLILDFSLAMEQDRDGDLGTDGESVFLRNFLSHRKLLRAPLAESLLWMKWFASKRAILLDLFFYFIFISCLTGVICSSTHRGGGVERKLSKPESAIVDLVLANYRGELKRRGWRFLPRSRPNVDTMINISDNISHPLGSSLFNSATLSSLSPLASPASSTVSPSAPRSAEKLLITAGKSVTFLGFYSFTVILSAVFLLRELLELLSQGPRRYFSSAENIFEIFIIFLTISCQLFLGDYSEHVYIYEILQVLTVFFGWFGLTFHFAKLPNIGIYIYLAIKVFRQLVLSLLVFTTILLAFSFSFHLALRKHHVFDNAFTSFLKCINMMAGEYNFDYNFTFQSVRDVGGSNGVVQILLLAFILLVSVTIANLIIAIVIANISKFMEEADYYQLEKTVDLLSTVHNIKQTIIRIFPSSKQIFAPTLHDYVGQKTHLCVKITETNPSLSMLVRIQNSFRSASSRFYPVYTYDTNYREAGPQTDLVLPEKILSAALEICREREKEHFSFPGYSDYSSDWRDLIGDMSFPSLDSSILPIPR